MDVTATNETIVHLTPSAAEEVKSLLSKPENAGKTLRVYVEQGGCSGMQYRHCRLQRSVSDTRRSVAARP